MENIIVNRLFFLIQINPSIEKKKLADMYRNQFLPITDRDIDKSLQYLSREKCIFAFRDRRGVASWWEAKIVQDVLAIVVENNKCSTRQLYDFYREESSRLDIVAFQKLLMQLRERGNISLVHDPAPSHWILNQAESTIQKTDQRTGGVLLQCA